MISAPIVLYYMTNMVGMVQSMPTIKATADFNGLALVDASPYLSANTAYGSTNTFYRQVRNFQLDTTNMAASTLARGIHWPTAQATSLQNIVFRMSQANGNKHQGVFIEEGI
jgi:glucan 1,3-beta-glucosidase